MAAGDLSPDQARFVQQVALGSGLDPRVVTAWVGAESGWNVNKANHNYLNIGPGVSYASTDQAAQATTGLIRSSATYAPIVNAVPQGPGAQIQAIGASKWGTSATTLASVFQQLTGINVVAGASSSPLPTNSAQLADFKVPGWVPFAGGSTVPTSPGDVFNSVSSDVSKVAGAVTTQLLQGILAVVFGTGAIALIGLGVERLTGQRSKQAVGELNNTVTAVKSAQGASGGLESIGAIAAL